MIERKEHPVKNGIEITIWFNKQRHTFIYDKFIFIYQDGKVIELEEHYKIKE